MNAISPPQSLKRLTAPAIVLAALMLSPLTSAMAQMDFSKNVDTTAVAKNESQAITAWGQRVCITVTLNADGRSGVASIGYGITTDDDGDPNTPRISGTENINAWNIAKDTAGYPGNRFEDFSGNRTNIFRGVVVADGEDHIGNVYWISTGATKGTGTFKAVHPKGYGRGNQLWVEIDTPTIKVNRYQSLEAGSIGNCGGY